ncbi:MAG: hypothetical protein PHF95_01230, partial [bacterium]|nr:hypothetical protein [bacterium]
FYTVMFLGMTPLGSFLAGLLADWLTVPYAVVIGGLTALVMTILLSRAIFKTHPDQANLILDNKNL